MKLSVFLVCSILILPQVMSGQDYKDQGIWNEFHRKNIGTVIFSTEKIIHNAPDASLVKSTFDLTKPIKARIYLDKSIGNWYNSITEQGDWNHGTFRAPIGIRYKIDGVVKAEFIEMINSADQVKTWTTWWYDLINTRPMPWNAITGKFFLEAQFGELVEALSPGKHSFTMEVFLVSKDQKRKSSPIALGSCELNFNKQQKDQWLKQFGAQVLFNGPSGDYRVTIDNTCTADINYVIIRPNTANYPNTLTAGKKANAHLNYGDQIWINNKQVFTASHGDMQYIDLCKLR